MSIMSAPEQRSDERPLMIAYWGRRGALGRFTLNLMGAMTTGARTTVSVARGNELFANFAKFGDSVFPVDTFSSALGVLSVSRLMHLRHALEERLVLDHTRAFVSLMPHIWSPLIAGVLRRQQVRHVAVVHDADRHPGDDTAYLLPWLLREAHAADRVVTLSQAVADRLIASRGIAPDKVTVLFHPDISFASETVRVPKAKALRVLFLGRIMPYKGLSLFVDAVEMLRERGVPLDIGVFGSGDLGPEAARLVKLGAEVVNRWIAEDEFAGILRRYDVVVLSHTEASQSGVIAAAFGAGLPVVVTPVGGLSEQVTSGVNGIITGEVTSEAIAAAIWRLANDRSLLQKLQDGVRATGQSRSMEAFRDALMAVALDGT